MNVVISGVKYIPYIDLEGRKFLQFALTNKFNGYTLGDDKVLRYINSMIDNHTVPKNSYGVLLYNYLIDANSKYILIEKIALQDD